MKEIFDIINFFTKYYNAFIFKVDDQFDEKLNKSIMFLIYISIIFYYISSNFSVLPISILLVLLLLKFTYNKEEFVNEEKKCRKPTNDNPFMNANLYYDGLEACDVKDEDVMKKYNHNLKKNIKDVFDKNTGQVYFRTNNVTTVPNKYKEFLDFVGMTYDERDNNCKYDGVNCLKYNDLRIR
jgi:hypothetical protein